MVVSEQDLFLAQQNSEHTRATYARGLAVFSAFTNKPYNLVTDEDVIRWKEGLTGAPATQFTRWTAVRSYYTWLVRSGRLRFSPFDAVKAPRTAKNRVPRIPSDDQFLRLASVPLTEDRDWRDRAIIYALGNGLRCGEVVSLTLDAVSYVEDYGLTIARVIGKGDKERMVPLSPVVSESIREWMLRRTSASDRVFTTGDEAMTVRQVQSAVARMSQRSSVRGVSAHSLRHHYATRLIRAGASVFSVQKLLGHESVATTQIYVNLDMSDTVEASRLDPIG